MIFLSNKQAGDLVYNYTGKIDIKNNFRSKTAE